MTFFISILAETNLRIWLQFIGLFHEKYVILFFRFFHKAIDAFRNWRSHRGGYEDYCFLVYNTMYVVAYSLKAGIVEAQQPTVTRQQSIKNRRIFFSAQSVPMSEHATRIRNAINK
jgi:hypothetical protein